MPYDGVSDPQTSSKPETSLVPFLACVNSLTSSIIRYNPRWWWTLLNNFIRTECVEWISENGCEMWLLLGAIRLSAAYHWIAWKTNRTDPSLYSRPCPCEEALQVILCPPPCSNFPPLNLFESPHTVKSQGNSQRWNISRKKKKVTATRGQGQIRNRSVHLHRSVLQKF